MSGCGYLYFTLGDKEVILLYTTTFDDDYVSGKVGEADIRFLIVSDKENGLNLCVYSCHSLFYVVV